MHPSLRRAALALAVSIAWPVTVQAADEATVVVTATRQQQRVNELLGDVSVIAREEIEQAGQASVEQLLATRPGIEYAANGGPGTNSSIFIRGANANHTLVLIDGQRVGSASSGSAAFSRIPLSQIDRIEILRGPASSLYGADAVGGVIQVFTRRGEGAPRFNASAGYGTYNTTDTGAGVSGGTDTVSYSLQAGYYETGGFSAIRNPVNSSYNIDRDGYRNTSFSGSIAFRPAQGHEVGLNLLHSSGTNKYDSTPKAGDFSNEQDVSAFSAYSRNRLSKAWTSTLRLGRSTDDSTDRTDGVASSVFHTGQDQATWQNDIKLPVGKALLAAEYLRQQLSSTTAFPVTERSIRSLLAGWNGSFDGHRLQFNLRRDDNSQFGGKTTGFAGYGYQFTPEWRAHVSYGTAFRAPSFNDLYFPDTGFGGGNPNLRPELARNREGGIIWERGDHRFSAIYFNNRVTDLIAGWPPANVSKATLSGTSLGYDGSFSGWIFGISADLQRPRDDITGKRLVRRADEQLKTRVSRMLGNWNVGGEWQLVGERYENAANTQRLGGYGLVNLFADYRLDRDWVLFARGNNIFDKGYELARDYATPGGSLFVGVRYTPK
ncbi:MAG: TonB-dependent receptor [Rhodocyclaceae bacterium]|jgi:vitamin B12 transporter|nr:TonB-dependent receptor [Rhodocyclaceae bacterium]